MDRRATKRTGGAGGDSLPATQRRTRGTARGVELLLALLLALITFRPAAAQERIDETRAAASDGVVEVRNVAGSVEVIGWDRAEVRVTGTLGEGVEELEIDTSGRRGTRIEVHLPRDGHVRDGDADLRIQVPTESEVVVSTVSAGVRVEDVEGDLDLKSVSGAVVAGPGSGSVQAESISGAVQVAGGRDDVEARSTSGRVEIRDVAGVVEASSVSGGVDVSGSTFREVQLETVSGSVRFRGDVARDATVQMESMSGSIELVVPEDVDAELDLSTFSGSLSLGFEVEVERSRGWGSARDVELTLGSGGARIVVETFSGSITVRGS